MKKSLKNKFKIAVLMGGQSPEHEISILSGQQVVKNLDENKYEIVPVVVSKEGDWQLTTKNEILNLENPIKLKGTDKNIRIINKKNINIVDNATNKIIDVFFIAMHGPFGEDGTIQGMLELTGIPYTGSGVLASALGMDKLKFRKIMEAENIKVPSYIVINKITFENDIKKVKTFPCFVKPHNQGSSVGAFIVKNKTDLIRSLKKVFNYSDIVLVDDYIKGREFTCGVMGNNNPFALPVIEIIPKRGEFFDYNSKYSERGSMEVVPAEINKKLLSKIQKISIKVFNTIGCKGFSRVDFLMDKREHLYVLEINTIPGLTPMSLLPKSAIEYGYTFSSFLDEIINYAIKQK